MEYSEGLNVTTLATLDEVSAVLIRPGAKPLSDIILEQRGPNE